MEVLAMFEGYCSGTDQGEWLTSNFYFSCFLLFLDRWMTTGNKLIQWLKKKEANLEKYNSDLTASSFSLWLSFHFAIVQRHHANHFATMQHHNAKLKI